MRFFRSRDTADPPNFKGAAFALLSLRYAEASTRKDKEQALGALCCMLETTWARQATIESIVREMMASGTPWDLYAAARVACTGASPQLSEELMRRVVEAGLALSAKRLLQYLGRKPYINEVRDLTARYVMSGSFCQATEDALNGIALWLPDRDYQVVSDLLRKKKEKGPKPPWTDIPTVTA